LQALAKRFPRKLSVNILFDLKLAKLIYAGSDFVLMPSLYEPSGLVQMIGMRYGTIPVVRSTGGLYDTVPDIRNKKGLGITFSDFKPKALTNAISRAINLYPDEVKFNSLRKKDMKANFTWDKSAGEYVKLYEKAVNQLKKDLKKNNLSKKDA
jgi:starch synthase